MPQIVIEQPGVPPMTVDLVGPEVSFGRSDENTVVLIADGISRQHSRIRLVQDKTILDDLQSLNGTYVNRQRVMERVLNDQDEVWFGSKCRAIFTDDNADVLAERKKQSSIFSSLAKIKHEMDDVTASMTMIHKAGDIGGGPDLPMPDGVDTEKLSRAFRRLDALYKATQLISSDFDLEQRISDVLDLAMEVTKASRGFLMMMDEVTGELVVKVARDMDDNKMAASSPSMGIARRAAIDGEPVLMADSDMDSSFGQNESIIMQRIETAMCVPLQVKDRVIGSLYVDARGSGTSFTQEELEMFHAMANQAAMAIENVRLHDQMVEAEKKKADLGRFLSPAVVKVIMEDEGDVKLGGQKLDATILYCDIRGFTPLSEGLPPEALVDLLNDHFTAMTNIVFEFNGTLDKYIGDEVMALFGAPFSAEDDALLAVRASVKMRKENTRLNAIRIEQGLPTFEIGIGVNSGNVFSGYIGSPERLDYTVMGDGVNIASRLCSVAREGQIIIGPLTNELVKGRIETVSAGTPVLKGKTEVIEAFEVIGLRPDPAPVSS
ncbi:MAG TPA: GAF domain-containing protein [Candidatus Hydrogenedentes bacterium]|nr:GAF domain-containing protein [Candidatus Hydrogenedentota bacterium]